MAELSEEMKAQTLKETEQGSKSLAEKSDYYYAHNSASTDASKPLIGAQTIYNHKPLNQEEVEKLKASEQEREKKQEAGSTWNAGTWENKDFSKAAASMIRRELKGAATPNDLATFTMCFKVDDCACGVLNSRGRKRPFLEVETLECNWEGKEGKGKGKITVTELNQSAEPDDIRIKVTFRADRNDEPLGDEDKKALEKELKSCGKLLKEVVNKVLAELQAGNLEPNKPETDDY